MTIDNAAIAEILATEAEQADGILKRAFKRAARAAFLWPVEASELLEQGKPLTDLVGIGPYLEKRLRAWIEHTPKDIQAPPLRQNFITLARARTVLAKNPEWQRHYRGDLQMHSKWSDGTATIQEMAEAARQRGYEYIAITDHSQGLKIAGGISGEELLQQRAEIDRINLGFENTRQRFRVLRSIELNLNPRGEGDMPETILESLDLVVGSFHSKLREKTDQTERYLAGLRNPSVNILGHPVGRIYNHRLGLSADWPQVCATATQLDKALEVDAYPDRQDLNVELLRVAKTEGTRIALDTDAHTPEQLGFIELGLAAALLAGIPAERVVNFMPLGKLLRWGTPAKVAA